MADDKLVYGVELDTSGVDKGLKDTEKKAKSFGEKLKDSFGGAKKGLDDYAVAIIAVNQGLGLVGKTIGTIKKAFELLGDGAELIKLSDKIRATETRFSVLAERALGAGNGLKQAFEESAAGLVDNDELLASASKSLIALEGQAAKLPEVFDVAKNSAKLFGLNALDSFENLTAAIRSGSAKSDEFRMLGIDGRKVLDEYAKSVGTTADKLNLLQKQTALTNAVISEGAQNIKGLSDGSGEASKSFQKLSVAWNEAKDSFAIGFASVFGPIFKKFSDFGTGILTQVSNALKQTFGTASEKTEARMAQLKISIEAAKLQLTEFNKEFNPGTYASAQQSLKKFGDELQRMQDIQSAAQDDARKAGRTIGGVPANITAAMESNAVPIATPEEVAKRNIAFQQALFAADQENLQFKIAQAQAIQDEAMRVQALDKLMLDQEFLAKQEHELRIAELENQKNIEKSLNKVQFNELKEAEERRHENSLTKIKADSELRKQKLEEASNKAKLQGAQTHLGQIATLQENASGELAAVGKAAAIVQATIAGYTAVAEAFKWGVATGGPPLGFTFAALVGTAAAANVAKIAGVGGGGSAAFNPAISGGGGGSIGGGVGATPGPSTQLPDNDELQIAGAGTTVNITVQGNILDRRQTGLELSEVIREAFETQGAVSVQGSFA